MSIDANAPSSSQLDALGAQLLVPASEGAAGSKPSTSSAAAKGARTAKGAGTAGAPQSSDGPDMGRQAAGEEDAILPPLQVRDAPGYFKFMPPLVRELWNKGAELTLDARSGEILIDGFYRNGALRLLERDGHMVAVDRRNRETPIQGFEDLARINHQWWRSSSKRGQYVVPNRPWLDHFIQNKWAKRQVIYVPSMEAGAPTGEIDDDDDQRGDGKSSP